MFPLSRWQRLLPLLLSLLLLLPATSAAQDQRAFLDLTLNGVAKGDALVVIRAGDALVSVARLTEAGLQAFTGRRETIGGEEFVSLSSLAPLVTFRTDEADLSLTITADPQLLAATVRDLQQGAPAGLTHSSAPSGFLNYALTTSSAREYDIFTESAFSARGGLLYNTTSMTPRGAVRGLSSLTFDDRSRLRRWVLGDSFAGGTALGGDALLAGIAVSREFSLAPYFVRYPTLSMSTPIAAPSIVEVHVNGRLVRQEEVQPGRLDLRNLPLTTGANDTRVTVRDPFGGTRELSTSYYLTTSVLAPGIQEYQYAVGFRRNAFGRASWDYSQPALMARHRVGVTDWLSAGVRVEADRQLASSGTILNIRVPFGELEAAAGASRADGHTATAAQLSYSYAGRLASMGGSFKQTSAKYTVIGAAAAARAPRELSMFSSVPVGGSNISVQHSEAFGDAAVRQRRTSIAGSMRVHRIADLTASVTPFRASAAAGTEASLSLTLAFGGRIASTSVSRGRDGMRTAVDVQQPLPVNRGFGYQLHAETGERNASAALLQYQGPYGRYEVRNERTTAAGAGHTTVNVAGAIVGIGGGLYATRPVRNSFALVRVPGVTGVRAYSSHQEIGRTNRKGDLLIPDLLPYYGNELNIADTDIPLDYVVPDVDITLAPPYRGGAVVLFPVQRVQRVTGSIVIVDRAGEQQPAFGELAVVVAGETLLSPLGAKGEFYFENLREGRHPADVRFDGTSCRFVLTVPRSEAPALDVGDVKCTVIDAR
jgi:outer membrane usher protein